MPRSTKTKPVVLHPEVKQPEPFIISPEERQQFRDFISGPIMHKIWTNARAHKPGVHFAAHGDPTAAMNRLHEIRGWEMFEAAILLQTSAPQPPRKSLEETYPNELH